MNLDVRRLWLCIALIGSVASIAGVTASPARASLGGSEATVEIDRQQVGATLRVIPSSAYIVHELQVPSGTVVREYVSPAGNVFGVAWQGPSMPDLRQLLGAYFDQYVEASSARKARGPISIERAGLVLQSGGHMRAFVGRAYIPAALPQGVVADAVR
jgi:Protein of unknown function (DUF2844)